MAFYFVTGIGLVLELTAICLHNREMADLVQFALYFATLGFHIKDTSFCRHLLYLLFLDLHHNVAMADSRQRDLQPMLALYS